jgi:hypothetical protein
MFWLVMLVHLALQQPSCQCLCAAVEGTRKNAPIAVVSKKQPQKGVGEYIEMMHQSMFIYMHDWIMKCLDSICSDPPE